MILSRAELEQLTGYKQRSEQIRVLDDLRIPHKLVGRQIVVMACHVQAWMENRPIRQEVGVDLSSVR
jgi:hypothetical protein